MAIYKKEMAVYAALLQLKGGLKGYLFEDAFKGANVRVAAYLKKNFVEEFKTLLKRWKGLFGGERAEKNADREIKKFLGILEKKYTARETPKLKETISKLQVYNNDLIKAVSKNGDIEQELSEIVEDIENLTIFKGKKKDTTGIKNISRKIDALYDKVKKLMDEVIAEEELTKFLKRKFE